MRPGAVWLLVLAIPAAFAAYSCSEGGYGHDWILFDNVLEPEMESYLAHYVEAYETQTICELHKSDADRKPCLSTKSRRDMRYCLKPGDMVSFVMDDGTWSGEDSSVLGAKVVTTSAPPDDGGCPETYNVVYNQLITSKDRDGVKQAGIAYDLPRDEVRLARVPECHAAAKRHTIGYHSSGSLRGVEDDDYRTVTEGCELGGPGQGVHYPVHDVYARGVAFLLCLKFADPTRIRWGLTAGIAVRETGNWFVRLVSNADREFQTNKLIAPKIADVTKMLFGGEDVTAARNCRDFESYFRQTLEYIYHTDQAKWGIPALRLMSSSAKKTLKRNVPTPKTVIHVASDDACDGCNLPPSLEKPKLMQRKDTCAGVPIVNDNVYLFKPTKAVQQTILRKKLAETETPEQCFAGEKDYHEITPEAVQFETFEKRQALSTSEFGGGVKVSVANEAVQAKMKHSPVGLIDDDDSSDLEMPYEDDNVEEPTGVSGSLASSSKVIGALSTYSSYKALVASGYSQGALQAGTIWLDDKLGAIGRGFAAPLHFLAAVLAAAEWLMAQVLLAEAKAFGFCPVDSLKEECLCDVVEPMITLVREIVEVRDQDAKDGSESLPPTTAITLLFSGSAGGHGSIIGGGVGGVLYIQLSWDPNWEFEIGGSAGTGMGLTLGTDGVSAGVDTRFKTGIFFGRRKEMSAWSKGFAVGANAFVGAAIGLDFLFHKKCKPIEYLDQTHITNPVAKRVANTFLRAVLMPVNPKCIRGVYLAIHVDLHTTPTFVDFNIHTGYGIGKKVAFMTLDKNGVRSELVEGLQDLSRAAQDLDVQGRNIEDDLREKILDPEEARRHLSARQHRHVDSDVDSDVGLLASSDAVEDSAVDSDVGLEFTVGRPVRPRSHIPALNPASGQRKRPDF